MNQSARNIHGLLSMNGIYETCFSDETVKPVVSGKYDFQILLFQIWHLLILVDCRANGKNCNKVSNHW